VTDGRNVARAERFRTASTLERAVDRVRALLPARVPAVLRRAYENALDALPGERLMSVFPGGERVRVSARYRHLSWNPDEYAAFRAAVRPGAIVLDVGANVGAYTLLFAQWVRPAGRVFAFEPAPETRAGLERHLAMNGVADRVEVVEAAVAGTEALVPFAIDAFGGASSLHIPPETKSLITVRSVTIDGFCAARRITPDVVKIDVEGAEVEALKGGRRVLSRDETHVFVELHPSVWASRGVTPAHVQAELRTLGFSVEPLHQGFDVWSMEGVCSRLRRS
jgi:FkbM family methyltransferase